MENSCLGEADLNYWTEPTNKRWQPCLLEAFPESIPKVIAQLI